MTVFTVDVSHHDWDRKGGALDWTRIRQAGIGAMCAKLTQGVSGGGYVYEDPRGISQIVAARAKGLALAGGYHVLIRGHETRQVRWFAQQLDMTGANWAMVDVEPFDELQTAGVVPNWDSVVAFATEWRDIMGWPLAVYLPKWVWSGTLGSPDMSKLTGLGAFLVSSNYGSNLKAAPGTLYAGRGAADGSGWAAYGGLKPKLWQFGSQAIVPGASSTTDINAFEGSMEQLHALLVGTEEEDVTNEEHLWLKNLYNGLFFGGPSMGEAAPVKINGASAGNALIDLIQDMRKQLAVLATDQVDEADIAARVIAGLSTLTPQAIADAVVAALPADEAERVVDALAARLGR